MAILQVALFLILILNFWKGGISIKALPENPVNRYSSKVSEAIFQKISSSPVPALTFVRS